MLSNRNLLHITRSMIRQRRQPRGLDALAQRTGWSKFHLQRRFTRLLGESPRQYQQRLQLEEATVALQTTDDSILDIALATGYASHEVFVRAFRRHFKCTPSAYRARSCGSASRTELLAHAQVVRQAGPCIGLYHMTIDNTPRRSSMPHTEIVRKDVQVQPILFIRRRVAQTELQPLFAECFGKLYGHCVQTGAAIAGNPMARYVDTGQGLWTVDCIVPLLKAAPGEGEMEAGELQGGTVAFTVHNGPYEKLGEVYVAIERWMEEQGVERNGPPWEWYVTDPGEHPDPNDWKTEVFWPITE